MSGVGLYSRSLIKGTEKKIYKYEFGNTSQGQRNVGLFSMGTIYCVIQARTGSTRLPSKVLKSVGRKLLIEHVVDRCLKAFPADHIILATTNLKEDDVLVKIIRERYKIGIFRGDSMDVRSRFTQIAGDYNAFGLVRVTADDPFKDPRHLLKAVRYIEKESYDYYNNFEYKSYPTGLDVESVVSEVLFDNVLNDFSDLSREHVTWGIRKDPRIKKFLETTTPLSNELRLTIDTQDELVFCSSVAVMLERDYPDNYDYEVTINVANQVKLQKGISKWI
jgi:spore coat polysaccharide biosynthesis protein SpsF